MKKIIAIATTAVLVCSIFAGCASGNTSKTNSSGKTTNNGTVSATQTPETTKSTTEATKAPENDKSTTATPSPTTDSTKSSGKDSESSKSDKSGTSSSKDSGSSSGAKSTAADSGKSNAEKGSAQALTDILTAIKDEYAAGTAGCSLVATKLAGQLLDWNAAKTIKDDDIKTAVHEFFSKLGNDAAVEYVEQMNAVYSAAKQLYGDDAESLLETAGYEAEAFPWAEKDVTGLFTTIYAALGTDMPKEDAAA